MKIAVYCGSAVGNDPYHAEIAEKLGARIGKACHTLVYGGSDTGLMGITADAVMKEGGAVIGVLPNVPLIHERRHPSITKYFLTEKMSERKDKMIELSDAYIALPGGYGTLDEISDILCLTRIGVMKKPVVLVNASGFYEPLRMLAAKMVENGFVGQVEMDNVLFSEDVDEIIDFIERGV